MYHANKKQFTILLHNDIIIKVESVNYFKACLELSLQGLKAKKLINSTSYYKEV